MTKHSISWPHFKICFKKIYYFQMNAYMQLNLLPPTNYYTKVTVKGGASTSDFLVVLHIMLLTVSSA